MQAGTLRRRYLTEAFVMLAAARLAVRLAPAARLVARANRPPRRPCRFAVDEIAPVVWAVGTLAATRWMRVPVLPRAVAVQIMLRRRGIASQLCVGVARVGNGLALHAWVKVGQDTIFGGRHPSGPAMAGPGLTTVA